MQKSVIVLTEETETRSRYHKYFTRLVHGRVIASVLRSCVLAIHRLVSEPATVHMPPRIIRLNVGGYVVQTAASTLTSGSAYFARLLSSEFTDLDAESNEAFVDRDGRYFPYILGYLRSGAVELPAPPLTVDALLAEAEYFAIDALVEALRVASAPAEVHIGRPLKADGQGMYVWKDAEIPGFIEAVCFTESSDEQHEYERLGLTRPGQAEGGGRNPNFGRYAETGKMYGSLIYSRGPCARENLIALRNMPQPLPNIWRDSGDASTIIAFFMQIRLVPLTAKDGPCL